MLLTFDEAAAYLRCSAKSLRKIIDAARADAARGEQPRLQFLKLQKRDNIVFRQEWLDEYVNNGVLSTATVKRKYRCRSPMTDSGVIV